MMMPLFKGDKGEDRFSMNPQVGKARAGKLGGGSPKGKENGNDEMTTGHGGASATFLHAHGDGTYHTEHEGGGRTEHPTLGHALMHMANHHEPGGKHAHVHSEGGVHTLHTVDENGNHEGPHDHQNLDELHSSMDRFLDEEGQEGQSGGYGSESSQQEGGNSDLGHLMV
jgi:hypothetical protein